MNRVLAVGIFFLSPFLLIARTQVTVSANPPEAAVGDRITFRIIVKTDTIHDGLRLDAGGGGEIWEETARSQLPPREIDGQTIREIHLTAAFFRTGNHSIGPFRINLERNGNKVEELSTRNVEVSIRSVLEESQNDIADLKPPVAVSGNPARILPWAAGALLLITGLLLGFVWIRRHRRRPAAATPPPPPLDELEEALNRLMARGLFGRGMVKEFCLCLTPILKRFLQRNYGFNAGEMTSRETLTHLAVVENDDSIRNHFHLLLELSDQVKFARFEPGPPGETRLQSLMHDLVDKYRTRESARRAEEENVPPGE